MIQPITGSITRGLRLELINNLMYSDTLTSQSLAGVNQLSVTG